MSGIDQWQLPRKMAADSSQQRIGRKTHASQVDVQASQVDAYASQVDTHTQALVLPNMSANILIRIKYIICFISILLPLIF